MIKKLSVGFVTLFASSATNYSFSGDSGTQSFAINPGQNEVIFSPNKTGGWWFKTWHIYKLGWPDDKTPTCNCIGVFTFWKDNNNPNDTWHYWPGGGDACLYFFNAPNGRTLLYSGKPSIAYKFVFSNYNDWGATVKISLAKL